MPENDPKDIEGITIAENVDSSESSGVVAARRGLCVCVCLTLTKYS